jgi:hypothetical protein
MDMKRHLLICFVISMLMGREKAWDDYKMEVVRLGNEVVVFAIISKMSKDNHMIIYFIF